MKTPVHIDWGKILLPAALTALCLSAASFYLLRDLWFDEALTILNFALLPTAQIYRSYVIPNNHILYTVCLHWHLQYAPDNFPLDWFCRLPSLLFSLLLLLIMFRRYAGRFGRWNWLVVLAAFALSPGFLVYATAVRGYMLGILSVALAMISAEELARHGKWTGALAYFAASWLSAGVLPSDLAALGAIALYAAPLCGKGVWKKWRFYALGAIPAAAFLLFYLPIFPQLLRAASLGEGWDSGAAVLTAFAVAAFIPMLPIWAAAGFGLAAAGIRGRFFIWRCGILVLIFVLVWGPKVPPFPRVLTVFLPLLLLAAGQGLRHLAAYRRLKAGRRNSWRSFGILAGALSLAWSVALLSSPAWQIELSRYCGGEQRDDFFRGYYLLPNHTPGATAQALSKLAAAAPRIYMSFAADPWPLMFYGELAGIAPDKFVFDGPRGQVPALPDGSLAVLHVREDIAELEKRFALAAEPVGGNANHRIYMLRRRQSAAGALKAVRSGSLGN